MITQLFSNIRRAIKTLCSLVRGRATVWLLADSATIYDITIPRFQLREGNAGGGMRRPHVGLVPNEQ